MQYMLGRYRVQVPYRNLFRAWKPGKEGYEGYMGDSDNHRLNNYMYARDDQRDHVEAFDCRKIRLIEGNEKCRHLKKLTCKGALRQVFICLRLRTPYPSPPTTHCICVYSILMHTRKGS
jgi:hypothetical protein